jgi:hypothetical protein
MGFVSFIDGVIELADGLAELERREREGEPSFALGALLLFHGEDGLDGAVAEYVKTSWEELDATTGGAAIVFVPAGMDGPLSPGALVDLINHVRVPYDALPCLWYFVDPGQSDQVTYVPLAHLVRPGPGGAYSDVEVRQTMRVFASSVWDCVGKPAAPRLACVDKFLVGYHHRVFPEKARRPKLRLEHISLGLSVVQVLMGLPLLR